jgi:hypothetical protein
MPAVMHELLAPLSRVNRFASNGIGVVRSGDANGDGAGSSTFTASSSAMMDCDNSFADMFE